MAKKRHHYLSEFYLKGFALDPKSPRLHVYAFERGEVQYLHPDEIAVEKNLYTIEGVPKADQDTIEDMFQELESLAAPVISALKNSKTGPVGEDRETLAIFVSGMLLRVPAIKQIVEGLARQSLKLVLRALVGHYDDLEPEIREQLIVSKDQLIELSDTGIAGYKFSRNLFLDAMMGNLEELARLLLSMNWTILDAPRGEDFVTSDRPVAIIDPHSNSPFHGVGLMTPGAEISFPLSRRMCLLMAMNGGLTQRYDVGPKIVDQMNIRTIYSASSTFYAGSYSDTLQSHYWRRRKLRERFRNSMENSAKKKKRSH